MPDCVEPSAAPTPANRTGSLRLAWPRSGFEWTAAGIAGAAWVYAACLGISLASHGWQSGERDWLADWGALPVQATALLLLAASIFRGRGGALHDRTAWYWVLAFTATSIVATYVWNTSRSSGGKEELSGPDLIYLADYWTLTAAFARWFIRAGGSFRARRVWLDAATMIVVLLVGLWSFFLGPAVANGTGAGISLASTAGYSITIVCMMSMAALLCMQTPSLRQSIPMILVVAAGLVDVAWEIMWMASWLSDRDFVGPFYNFGDVLCFAAVCTAVACTRLQDRVPSPVEDPERRMDSFLPALAVLVAIALVAGSLATTRRIDAWILVGLVSLCALLLITRQQSARREVRALNRQLALREADARLTELVRRSADLILVVDSAGLITYASPATQSLLAVSPETVQHTPAAALFGSTHTAALRDLLDRSAARPTATTYIELRVQRAAGKYRAYRLSAANQTKNALIRGIVLTVTDVTEQRMLEREVLDAASSERIRLSGEIHDGLGQELVGIAMLLHAASKARNMGTETLREHVQSAVGHLNRVVGAARDLARGLWPLGVVRGSLGGALGRLVPESGPSPMVCLDVDPQLEEGAIDDFCADHLYRIAQEAVNNALRHSGCTRIDIALRRTGTVAALEISDNGCGFDTLPPESPGLGSRLMEYRARIIGATLHVHHARDRGTRVTALLPLSERPVAAS